MSSILEILAIIPARGGSKGIPGKNIRLIGGKPLVEYSIQAALKAKSITRIIVSTDDEEIAIIARKAGAEVSNRPASISGDKASSETALLHVLDDLWKKERYCPDFVVFLQCTSPLTLPEDIDGIVSILLHEKADSAFSAMRFYHFLWRRQGKGAKGINHEENVRLMRQEREEQFLENGALYAFKTEGFKNSKHRFFGYTVIFEMPPERCLEIDEPHDFELAKNELIRQRNKSNVHSIPIDLAALVMDFDGVFTDNSVYVLEDGREAVCCDRGDGLGFSLLKRTGLPLLVLSTETNPVVLARCKKLGLPVLHGVTNKLLALREWALSLGIPLDKIVFIGNDINDLECINAVGCGVAVSDAVFEVLSSANVVLDSKGGHGALRELSELIINRMSVR